MPKCHEKSWHRGVIMNRLLVFGVLALLSISFHVFVHEEVHKQIFHGFGCVDARTHFGLNNFAFCADEFFVMSDSAQLAHSINEVVGYSVFSVLLGMLLCSFFIVENMK